MTHLATPIKNIGNFFCARTELFNLTKPKVQAFSMATCSFSRLNAEEFHLPFDLAAAVAAAVAAAAAAYEYKMAIA